MAIILALTRQKNPSTGILEFRPIQISDTGLKSLRRHLRIRRAKLKEEHLESPFIRAMEARKLIRGRSLLERAERAGWLNPVCRGKRMTLFKRQDVEACIARISMGDFP